MNTNTDRKLCHLNTCQTPTMAYCQESATEWITFSEDGVRPVDLMTCSFHTEQMIRECAAEIVAQVAFSRELGMVTIPSA